MSEDLDRDCHEIMTRCACEALRRTTRAVTATYQESLRRGVRATQLPILVAAQLMGPVPLSALASALVMDRTTLTRNLKGLQHDGLVRLDHDDDRRVRLVVLTEKGTAALEVAVEEWREAHARLVAAFGAERVGHLVAELGALTELTRTEVHFDQIRVDTP